MSATPAIPVFRSWDEYHEDGSNALQYDIIEYGLLTPDGIERYGRNALGNPYVTDRTDLSTRKGQEFAQAKFEKAVESAGIKYDANKHGRLQFVQRRYQVRVTPSQPLEIVNEVTE
jgi:hypothetical protein